MSARTLSVGARTLSGFCASPFRGQYDPTFADPTISCLPFLFRVSHEHSPSLINMTMDASGAVVIMACSACCRKPFLESCFVGPCSEGAPPKSLGQGPPQHSHPTAAGSIPNELKQFPDVSNASTRRYGNPWPPTWKPPSDHLQRFASISVRVAVPCSGMFRSVLYTSPYIFGSVAVPSLPESILHPLHMVHL